jgi:hypothetical protein
MLVILATGAAFGGWAALSLMGGERARRLRQIESRRSAAPMPITAPLAPARPGAASDAPAARRPTSSKPANPAAAKNAR